VESLWRFWQHNKDISPKAHLNNGTMSMLSRRLYGRMRLPVSEKNCKHNIMQNAMGTCMSEQLQNANDTRQQAYNTANITQLDWKMQQVIC